MTTRDVNKAAARIKRAFRCFWRLAERVGEWVHGL